jgi:hypothetical protein
MQTRNGILATPRVIALAAACVFTATVYGAAAQSMEWSGRNPVTAELSGAKEVPPVATEAYGKSTITVASDGSLRGSVIVMNMKPTSAHIHHGPLNADGPVVIPLIRSSENIFSVPPGISLTPEQYARYKEGNLYINVHSEKFPSGEIRAQMRP